MTDIIDIHTHLGNLLYPGESIIEKKNVKKSFPFDLLSMLELFDWPNWWRFYRLIGWERADLWGIKSSQARNATATRENMRREMDKYGINYCATMPVYPRVTFQDLKGAYEKDSTILPFTGADYAHMDGLDTKFAEDIKQGARGLKLHPILQQVRLNDDRTKEIVEAFSPYDYPVLFHSGVGEYYIDEQEKKAGEKPEYGSITDAEELVAAFPKTKFIAGHAGLSESNQVMELLSQYKNVWVDISFQPSYIIEDLIKSFGVERILYASDWPWGGMASPIRCVAKACHGDKVMERQIYYENAAELLHL